jgi:hypothetical protein
VRRQSKAAVIIWTELSFGKTEGSHELAGGLPFACHQDSTGKRFDGPSKVSMIVLPIRIDTMDCVHVHVHVKLPSRQDDSMD